jgi:hypothetical protein
LFPQVGFIVTNLPTPSRAVVRFHNKPSTAEQWIKEGKQAAKMTRLSCQWFSVEPSAAGVAEANRELVVDEFAATTGENRRTAGEACAYYWLFLAEDI